MGLADGPGPGERLERGLVRQVVLVYDYAGALNWKLE